jgi:tRNA pseudouridine55 synthase
MKPWPGTSATFQTMATEKIRRRTVDGVLLLDKPTGRTSNSVLQQVKRIYRARKAGHTGSLDPLASGMLPVCLGQATKLSSYLLSADKVYRVTARFGARTDTADADGQIVEESPVVEVSEDALKAVLDDFCGEIQQVPPMYSALKQDGKRLYELARQGLEVHREPRTVRIHALDIESFDPHEPSIRVQCSKGTYVRTLVEDIAKALGTLGHVIALRRLSVYPFEEGHLIDMEALEAAAEVGTDAMDGLLLPVDQAIADWPAVYLDTEAADYLRQGNSVNASRGVDSGLVRLYDDSQSFLGIGEVMLDGRIAPKRLFPQLGAGAA